MLCSTKDTIFSESNKSIEKTSFENNKEANKSTEPLRAKDLIARLRSSKG